MKRELKIKTHYNAEPSTGKIFRMPSETIQGQVLSIAEMLRRIQKGIPVNIQTLEYNELEEPLPKIQDLTDLVSVQDELKQLELNFEARTKVQNDLKEITEEPKTE